MPKFELKLITINSSMIKFIKGDNLFFGSKNLESLPNFPNGDYQQTWDESLSQLGTDPLILSTTLWVGNVIQALLDDINIDRMWGNHF